jgi:hypothetical protein
MRTEVENLWTICLESPSELMLPGAVINFGKPELRDTGQNDLISKAIAYFPPKFIVSFV